MFFGNDVWTNTAGGNWSDEFELERRCSGGVVDRRRHRGERRIHGDDLPIRRDGQANSLAITDRGATLTGSGTLSIATTLDNAGIIDATGCNFLHIETNTLINEYSGVIAALDGGNLTDHRCRLTAPTTA